MDIQRLDPKVVLALGYLDPEYFRRIQMTEKYDVYSFVVVLLEVLSSRETLNIFFPREKFSIAEWEMHWQKKGNIEKIIDPHLVGTINPGYLKNV